MKTYAAYYKNDRIRLESSSGGIFSALAEYVLSLSGVVYGVAMSDDCYSAEFIRVENESDLFRLRGSKYIQARMNDTFRNIKNDLIENRFVLFSGTSCQINGLRNFLLQDYPRLLCVDVICHGAPSPKLWRKYALSFEEKFEKIENVNFRNKDKGWSNFGIKCNEIYTSKGTDSYMLMFLRDYCLRPSCYKCVAKDKKLSDFTIADFWGIDNVVPEMNDEKGTSLVILRTQKGEFFFEKINEKLVYKEVSYEEGIKDNSAEYRSVRKPQERERFFSDMNMLSFPKLKNRYVPKTKIGKLVKLIRLKVGI